MSSKEITVWLDGRWYSALSRHLRDETVEDKLNDYLDQMINQLPEREREKISREIWEETQRAQQEWEAARVLSVFHVKEDSQEEWFQVDASWTLPEAARALRRYLRQEPGWQSDRFSTTFWRREEITAEEFNRLAALRMENTGKIAGAFKLDFGRQEFSALHITDGWKTWPMADVSNAAYHAFRKGGSLPEHRLNRLLDKLEGREIVPAGQPADDFNILVGTEVPSPTDGPAL